MGDGETCQFFIAHSWTLLIKTAQSSRELGSLYNVVKVNTRENRKKPSYVRNFIALASTFSALLNISGRNRHACLIPDLRESFHSSPLGVG